MTRLLPFTLLSLFVLLLATAWGIAQETAPPSRDAAQKLMTDGNYLEALKAFRTRLESPATDSTQLPQDLQNAVQSLRHLNRVAEFDSLVEKAVATHPESWRLLTAAANAYTGIEHYGFEIAGEFERGGHRGGGRVMHATERDQVRALQLLVKALALAEQTDEKAEAAKIAEQLANTLLYGKGGQTGWQLQALTNLRELPEYEEGWGFQGDLRAAPVDEENKPIYYARPVSWDEATSDGERWRWALARMTELDPQRKLDELMHRAEFLRSQFGVNTLANVMPLLLARNDEQGSTTGSIYTLHTLKDNETIARLATGIQRFELPEEHNFVALYQQVLQEGAAAGDHPRALRAAQALASLCSDRRQYDRAAEYWRNVLEHNPTDHERTHAQEQIAQIEQPWGQFERGGTHPAGQGASFEFRHRNATRVEFVAHQVKVPELLKDVKEYIRSKPRELDWNKTQVDQIGIRLVNQQETKYVGEEVARWGVELQPRDGHFDRQQSIASPLQKGGAYLVTAKVNEGNTSKMVLWVADTAIVKKPARERSLYFVADAVTGKPVANANLELFGFRVEYGQQGRPNLNVLNFAEATDANGQAMVAIDDKQEHHRYQWLTVATTPEGRFAYLGFHNVWRTDGRQPTPDHVRTFSITDRPVYRPGQKVHYKLWIERSVYDGPEESEFAHKTFQLEIFNPRNEKVATAQLTANAYGGVSGEYALPADATLGVYRLHLVNYGEGSFRVEEYKKPEFEVTVEAPVEPLALGDKFDATIEARYYFGEPVREGLVKYKVTRTSRTVRWFPATRWDWLYGDGHWWFGYDYDWYPGWRNWGCLSPGPWWIWRQPAPPEIVAQGESPLDAEGKLRIAIDSTLAKELHPDEDHDYQITAEVVDNSRRTIVGTGSVIVARKPFSVFAWTDRGHYRVGDTIAASFQARRADGKPVTGAGKLRLLSIRYPQDDPMNPVETEVRAWDLATDEEGRAQIQMKASEPGQYRLSYQVTSSNEQVVEGGYFFTIAGPGFDGGEFQFADLELIPDKREYAPGEKVKLQINTNRRNSTVLLFVRAEGSTYPAPRTVTIEGKSKLVEIAVAQGDMPNFFIEGLTVANGKVHTVARQVAVPPEKRVIQVEVSPAAATYLPGQEAKVKLRLTDHEGKPVVGDTALSIYDKAIEYISGGSNVGDIRETFWGWKRHHHPQTENNLERWSYNLVPPNEKGMQPLGMFGNIIQAEGGDVVRRTLSGGRAGYGYGQGRGGGFGAPMAPTAAMDGAPMEDSEFGAPTELQSSLSFSKSDLDTGGAEVAPTVRENFADTAFWSGSVETDSAGIAEVSFPMPDSLTTWNVKAWSMGGGARVGAGSAETVTRKNLLVRLQTPRFLVERDEVVISANVHNYLKSAKNVRVRLELEGGVLSPQGGLEQVIDVAPQGEQRVDWRLSATAEGIAKVRVLALTDEESDAMQLSLPVKVHGIEKLIPHSGVIAAHEQQSAFEVTVPSARRESQTRLEVQFSPTLAGAMVDALPYLIEYPYGCTEQTLNRFLPAVITQRTLKRMGVDLKAIRDKETNLNPQELGDPAERAAQWQRFKSNPVFDEAELDKVVKSGVNRLTEMQLSDGSWGWFSGWGESSSPHLTAVVARGLIVARQNEVALVPGTLERGIEWLKQYQQKELAKLANYDGEQGPRDKDKPYKTAADNLDALVYLVLVEAQRSDLPSADAEAMKTMRQALYRDRTRLAVYSLATFGLALDYQMNLEGDNPAQGEGTPHDMLQMVIRNLSQYVVTDAENQTAYLNLPQGFWWHWYGSEYEAHAYYLKLLAAHDPKSDVASGMVKYLLNNRKHATYWNSTRDTALVVEAMADYLAATGEGKQEMVVEVWLNGQRQKTVEITPAVLFSFDNRFVVQGDDIESGRHTVELRKQGAGRLYFNAYLSFFSLEEDIEAAGLELKVNRKYFLLTPVAAEKQVSGSRGQVINQQVEKYQRTEIPNLGKVTSGDLVEIELVIESKNDYEYVILEDLKAAGFEPVDVRSGYNGNELGAYMELRDDRVALFLRTLARGRHSVSYRMRAETPGKFSALPTKAYAMYAPELKANSNKLKVLVDDRPRIDSGPAKSEQEPEAQESADQSGSDGAAPGGEG